MLYHLVLQHIVLYHIELHCFVCYGARWDSIRASTWESQEGSLWLLSVLPCSPVPANNNCVTPHKSLLIIIIYLFNYSITNKKFGTGFYAESYE